MLCQKLKKIWFERQIKYWTCDQHFQRFVFVPAVQEERQRVKEKGEGEVESTSSANSEMPVERVLEAELAVEPSTDTYVDAQVSPKRN